MTKRKPAIPKEVLPKAIVGRVDRARGAYLDRTGRELTWSQIGAALGLGQTSYWELENGVRKFAVWELLVVAKLLGVRAGWLAFDEQPRTNAEWLSGAAIRDLDRPLAGDEEPLPPADGRSRRRRGA